MDKDMEQKNNNENTSNNPINNNQNSNNTDSTQNYENQNTTSNNESANISDNNENSSNQNEDEAHAIIYDLDKQQYENSDSQETIENQNQSEQNLTEENSSSEEKESSSEKNEQQNDNNENKQIVLADQKKDITTQNSSDDSNNGSPVQKASDVKINSPPNRVEELTSDELKEKTKKEKEKKSKTDANQKDTKASEEKSDKSDKKTKKSDGSAVEYESTAAPFISAATCSVIALGLGALLISGVMILSPLTIIVTAMFASAAFTGVGFGVVAGLKTKYKAKPESQNDSKESEENKDNSKEPEAQAEQITEPQQQTSKKKRTRKSKKQRTKSENINKDGNTLLLADITKNDSKEIPLKNSINELKSTLIELNKTSSSNIKKRVQIINKLKSNLATFDILSKNNPNNKTILSLSNTMAAKISSETEKELKSYLSESSEKYIVNKENANNFITVLDIFDDNYEKITNHTSDQDPQLLKDIYSNAVFSTLEPQSKKTHSPYIQEAFLDQIKKFATEYLVLESTDDKKQVSDIYKLSLSYVNKYNTFSKKYEEFSEIVRNEPENKNKIKKSEKQLTTSHSDLIKATDILNNYIKLNISMKNLKPQNKLNYQYKIENNQKDDGIQK